MKYVKLFESWINEAEQANPNAQKYKSDLNAFLQKSKTENLNIEKTYPCLKGFNNQLNNLIKKYSIAPIQNPTPESLTNYAKSIYKLITRFLQWKDTHPFSVMNGADVAIYKKDNKDEMGKELAGWLASDTAALQAYCVLREGVFSYLLSPEGIKFRKDRLKKEEKKGNKGNDLFRYAKEEDPVTNFVSIKDIPAEERGDAGELGNSLAGNPIESSMSLSSIIGDLKDRVKDRVGKAKDLEGNQAGVGTRILSWFF